MRKTVLLSIVISWVLMGCDEPAPGACPVEPPDTWDAPDFETNAAEALALRAQLDALAGETMRGAEQGTVTVGGVDDLNALFEAGDPSLASVATPFAVDLMADVFEEFVELVGAGPQDLVDESGAFVPGTAGGIFGTDSRGINEGGLEVRQLVDKGLFAGGALYNYALGLTEGQITPATVEAIGAAWGTHATLDPEMRTDSANYSRAMGYHARMVEALVAAHAYAADEACTAQRDEALRTFFRTWELSMFARFVYYANVAAVGLGAVSSDDDVAAALHEIAEGIGLALGFRGVATPSAGPLAEGGRVVTDAQIDAMMDALRVNTSDLGASTTGDFVADPAALGEAVRQVEEIVSEAFGLEPADIQAWRSPTAG
ncbi:MAG TPA: hypothetical protein VIL20_17680 [Sandaracinaceae bacterium]